MVAKVNEVRARHGLSQLRHSSALDGSSQRFARTLQRQNRLYHRARPSAAPQYRRAGEVLAMHTGRGTRIGATVRRWMRSSSHRAVLLSRGMPEIGAGVARGPWGGARSAVWVVQVGKR